MVDMPAILAFDTALGGCSVGVRARSGKIAHREVPTLRDQAKLLVPLIEETLQEAGTTYQELDLIASTIGPGSFTGLRIGLSTARSLALALDKPALGMNTLDVIARHYYDAPGAQAAPFLIVLETKRRDFYACCYDPQHDTQNNALYPPFAGDICAILKSVPKEIKTLHVGGDCLERFEAERQNHAQDIDIDIRYLAEVTQPAGVMLIELAHQYSQIAQNEDATPSLAAPLEPLYLRGADVSKPKNPPRKLQQKS